MTKIPSVYKYLQDLFDSGNSDWNPKEHEDWELPPLELTRQYIREYPNWLSEDVEIIDN